MSIVDGCSTQMVDNILEHFVNTHLAHPLVFLAASSATHIAKLVSTLAKHRYHLALQSIQLGVNGLPSLTATPYTHVIIFSMSDIMPLTVKFDRQVSTEGEHTDFVGNSTEAVVVVRSRRAVP